MNTFTMTIGPSSSQTGCLVTTEAPLKQIRDAIWSCKEKTGISIFDICSKNDIIDEEILEKLDKLGYDFPIELYTDDLGTHMLAADCLCDCPEIMLDMILFLLHVTDPSLHITAQSPDIPEIFLVGPDEKGRVWKTIGMGLFSV